MASAATKSNKTKATDSRRLIMEHCPRCKGNTAFEFDSATGYGIHCLNCGFTTYVQRELARQISKTSDNGN